MAQSFFVKIDGLDITRYIKKGGFKWSRNDGEGKNATRTMDWTMHRERIAIKIRLDISLVDLSTEEAMQILNAILPEYVEVEYVDPMYGLVTKTMYSNNVPATINTTNSTGEAVWSGITFPLVER